MYINYYFLFTQVRLVSDLIVHEDYDAFNLYNNICIVKLSQDLVFDRSASDAVDNGSR